MDSRTTNESATLETRVANIERILVRIESQLEQLPGLAATAADTIDSMAARANARGVDLDARIERVGSLLERLTDPQVVARLERAVEMSGDLPALAATATDTLDDAITRMQARGIDLDDRLTNTMHLVERLTEPSVTSALDKMLALAEAIPGSAAAFFDSMDDLLRSAQARGIDIDARLRAATDTLEKVSRPGVLQALGKLVEMAEEGPNLLAAMADTVDALVASWQERGVDVDARLSRLVAVVEKLTDPASLDVMSMLLERMPMLRNAADVFSEDAIDTVEMLAQSVAEASRREPPSMGLWGMARAMRRPSSRMALGFATNLVERFGSELRKRRSGKHLLATKESRDE